MGLDLEKVSDQIASMATKFKDEEVVWRDRLTTALALITGDKLEHTELVDKIEQSKATWLIPKPLEDLKTRYSPPRSIENYIVAAVDGSNIDIDRHSAAMCYLINIGFVKLQYGSNPTAELWSRPSLFANEGDLILRDVDTALQQFMTPALVGVKRMVQECSALFDAISSSPSQLPTVALMDGTLIPLGLIGRSIPEFVRRPFLVQGLLKTLSMFRSKAEQTPLAVASYISYPGSTEVVNSLRIIACPHYPFPDCDRHCSISRNQNDDCPTCLDNVDAIRECDIVSNVRDRDLFSALLKPGERSGVFASRSSIVVENYGPHHVDFFYVNVDDEVARVEIPRWVSQRSELLDLVHFTVLEQCRLGQGYPVALSEAHEQAVITGSDREEFWRMVDITQGGSGLSVARSAKARSKLNRWI